MTDRDHSVTPKMTRHALDRCQEMGIPARLAKGIYRKADVVYAATSHPQDRGPRFICRSDLFPGYAIVVEDRDTGPWVITIVFHTPDQYRRNGGTYETKD